MFGNLALSFSIIGGISTFVIIYFSIEILKIKINSKEALIVILILFFNPMIWILGNRYMPDLLGLAVAITSFYFLVYSKNKYLNYSGFFLTGILLGIRLSYFPLLIIPISIILLKKENIYKFLFYLFIGMAVWIIPFIITEEFNKIILLGYKHSIGHFNDYGGTIMTENDLLIRIKFLFHTIWSDGLGGYWHGRSWVTIFISFPIVIIFKQFFIKKIQIDPKLKILIFSSIVYLIWIFFFQNLIYKSRHVLPIVFILLILICSTIKYEKKLFIHSILILFLIILTSNIVIGHKKGTAISNMTKYLKNKKTDFVISNPLVNYYLKSNGINSTFINIENFNLNQISEEFTSTNKIKVIGNYSELFNENYQLSLDSIFYHNPYMNRMWSSIPIYSIK